MGFQFELDLNCKSLFLQSLAYWNYCQCLLGMCFSVVLSVGSVFEVYNSMVGVIAGQLGFLRLNP